MICNSIRSSARRAGCGRLSSHFQVPSAWLPSVGDVPVVLSSTATPQEWRRSRCSSSYSSTSTSSSGGIMANTRSVPIFFTGDPKSDGRSDGVDSSSSKRSAHRDDEVKGLSSSTKTMATPSSERTFLERWKAARSKVTAEYLKRFLKKYGRVAATFHISVFLTTLGTCYSIVDYGGLDIPSLVKDYPLLANNLPPASAGNLAIAYGMTSAIGPPRAILTVTLTPRIAKFLAGREENRRREEEKAA